jgi:Iron-containing alcohol dehydrogenase
MNDYAFEMAVSSIRFGKGVTREVGMDLAEMGATNVLVITDPVIRGLAPMQTVIDSLEANKIRYAIYDRVRVEPTDQSFLDAIAFARDGHYDAFVAIGGGSTIDTAKAVNLYVTYPPGTAQAADRHSDHGRHRQRDDRRQHFRSDEAARQDRDRQSAAEAYARHARSGQHADDAGGSGGVEWPRHPQPRDRVLHRDAVYGAAHAGSPGGAAGVPGIESN